MSTTVNTLLDKEHTMNTKSATILFWVVIAGLAGLILVQTSRPTRIAASWPQYEDGTYRGVFIDQHSIQVNVQFTLKNGVITEAEFRHLYRDEDYRLGAEHEPYKSVIAQYQEALDHLVGKKLQRHLADLYRPAEIVTTRVDGYTAATIRSNKIISAIRDALNRGVYSY